MLLEALLFKKNVNLFLIFLGTIILLREVSLWHFLTCELDLVPN